jgi:prolyl-tRNA editing enzyme YbaK/EbsC (Cys-tRNA(Pro) deacylase)
MNSHTTSSLSASAARVQRYLEQHGCHLLVRELPSSTRTAAEAAASIGCSVGQIAKSLIFREKNSGEAILVIASGSNLVDVEKIAAATGLLLQRADGKFIKEKVGFAIGGIPPVGHAVPLRTLLDPDLLHYPIIWAAAGTPHAVFQLTPAALEQLTQGQWLRLAQEDGAS